jgi:hypothetical protein
MLKKKVKYVELPATILDNIKVMQDPATKEKKAATAREAVEAGFLALNDCLYGLSDVDEDEVRLVRKEITGSEFVRGALAAFPALDLDCRKHVKNILACLLNKEAPKPMIEHLRARTELIFGLLDGVAKEEQAQTALLLLEMLKSCFQHRALVEPVAQSEKLWNLFACVELPDFAVSASAFLALKELLVSFPDVLAKAVTGDRKRTEHLVERCCRLLSVGSASQKKKSIDLIAQILGSADSHVLLADFAVSLPFAGALEKLASGKPDVAAQVAVVVKLLWPQASPEVKEVLRREPVVQAMRDGKVDVDFMK